MDSDKLIVSQVEGVLTIELNNPAKLNCMGFVMLRKLNDAIIEAENSKDVKVVILKGAGDRAFSTGADLKEFSNLTSEEGVEWIEFGNAVFNRIESLSKPTVAFIDGYAVGGGLELALSCDLRVGTSKAVLSFPELQHGWLPGWGGMTRMRRLFGESVAKEVVFLSEKINAEKALQLGMINRVVENENDEAFNAIIQQLISIDAEAFALAKTSIADVSRSTSEEDVKFDVMAMQLAQKVKS